ncbi:ME53 [Maruca vitrata nucleopolyhedrovirus]|uniref:ME53 n=1 Tax=Maruca vitrata nucleopolyhedrovirus TaxID=1307954 RepID=A1YRG9_9ABAC|nr:ME53 [Maruca vitrata nucleopolyhedrovirus]ABM05423.1 ME53 [Maruca vitrata nucleopolyhedrovirus]
MNRFFRKNNIFDTPKIGIDTSKIGRAKNDAYIFDTPKTFNPPKTKVSKTKVYIFDASKTTELVKTPSAKMASSSSSLVFIPPTHTPLSLSVKPTVNRRDGYFVPPDFGNKFEGLPKYSDKLDFKQERDLRMHFLSDLERDIMKATLKFATNYIIGYVNNKDMRMMGKFASRSVKNKKSTEHMSESRCTSCNYRFKDDTRVWFLYVVIHIKKPLDDPTRIDICCQDCYLYHNDALNSYEIYPSINSADLKHLAKERFFYQYIFPVSLDYTTEVKELRIDDHNCKVFEMIRRIIQNHKGSNECIEKIDLSTTGGLVLRETYNNIVLRRYRNIGVRPDVADDVDCFMLQDQSEMMDALQDNRFSGIKGTVFATVTIKRFTQALDGPITFPLKSKLTTAPNNYCKLCKKTKLYYKNPVLYCTKCGFTNVFHFYKYSEFVYCPEAVKSFEMHNEMILYYDLKMYKKLTKG